MNVRRTELIPGLVRSVTAVARKAKQASTPEEHGDAYKIGIVRLMQLTGQMSVDQMEEVVSEFDLEFEGAYRDEQKTTWSEAEPHLNLIYTTYMEDAFKRIPNKELLSEDEITRLSENFNKVCNSLSIEGKDRILFESVLMYGFCSQVSAWLQAIKDDTPRINETSTLLSAQAMALPFNIKKAGSKQFKTFNDFMNVLSVLPDSRNERVDMYRMEVEMECAKHMTMISFISNLSNE